MKYSASIFIIFICLGLGFTGCGNDDEKNNSNVANPLESNAKPKENLTEKPKLVEDDWFTGKVNLQNVSGLEGADLENTKKILGIIQQIEGLPKTYDRTKEELLIAKYSEEPVKYCDAYLNLLKLLKNIKHGFIQDMLKDVLYNNFRLVLTEASLKYLYLPITKASEVENTYLYLDALELIEKGKIIEAFESIDFSETGRPGYPVQFLYPRLGEVELKDLEASFTELKKKFADEIFPLYKSLLVYPTLVKMCEKKIEEYAKEKNYKKMFNIVDELSAEIQQIFKGLPESEFNSAVTKFNSKFVQKHIKELYKPQMDKLWDINDKYFYKTNIEINDEKLDEIEKELYAIEEEIASWGLAEYAVDNENTVKTKITEMHAIIENKRKENAAK